MVLGFS
jgi:Uncharacterized conserved protein, possibly involved in methylthioadenosine recycling